MKTCLDIPAHAAGPTYHYIDTAPLTARYAVLAKAILALVIAGRFAESNRLACKVVRLVRCLTRLEAHNVHLTRKVEMLSHKSWRERVLRELGGIRKLKLWEAARKRIMTRIANGKAVPAKTDSEQAPSWLYTPQRIAESERLKARVRMCGRATAHPRIFRDRYKMDVEGEFRLAPLPRSARAPRHIKVYTKTTIVDYEWNNIPFAKETGFGSAVIWPVEFYAAMAVEKEMLGEAERLEARDAPASFSLSPLPSCLPCKQLGKGDKEESSNDKRERQNISDARNLKDIATLPLTQALRLKEHHDFFGSLTS